MTKEQKINCIIRGFSGDCWGSGAVRHKIVNKATGEVTQLQWVGGCFGCYLSDEKLDVYDILRNDYLVVKLL